MRTVIGTIVKTLWYILDLDDYYLQSQEVVHVHVLGVTQSGIPVADL